MNWLIWGLISLNLATTVLAILLTSHCRRLSQYIANVQLLYGNEVHAYGNAKREVVSLKLRLSIMSANLKKLAEEGEQE